MANKIYNYESALLETDKDSIKSLKISSDNVNIDDIDQFKRLQKLILTGNKYIKDFQFLKSLSQLEEVYLSNMGINHIPEELTSLLQLKVLFINNNPINDFSTLKHLPQLEDIGLEGLGLTKIPDELVALKNLNIIGITNNNIKSIAPLGKMAKLEEIYASDNKLQKLPNELSSLKYLKKLYVSGNYSLANIDVLKKLDQLEALGMYKLDNLEDIANLVNLKELWIQKGIADLTPIVKFTQLEELELLDCEFTSIPGNFSELKKLKKLMLYRNEKLNDISNLKDLPQLEELQLFRSAVEKIPESFSTLKNLKIFDGYWNSNLADISGLKGLPLLEICNLHDTKIKKVPEDTCSLTKLKTFKITVETLKGDYLKPLVNLEEFLLEKCSFDKVPELKKLKKLSIIDSKNPPPGEYLKTLPALEDLRISGQDSFILPQLPKLKRFEITHIDTDLDLTNLEAAKQVEEIEFFSLKKFFTSLPKELEICINLKKLSIHFCKSLNSISSIKNFAKLEELVIENCNSLKSIHNEIGTNTNLKKISFDSLAVTDLRTLADLPKLQYLKLSDLKKLETLPDQFKSLAHLKELMIYDCEKLKDISVLKELPALEKLDIEYTDVPNKDISAVKNSIRDRLLPGAKLTMSYKAFIASGEYKKLNGKEDKNASYGFPLIFDTPENLFKYYIDDFTWLDDHRYDENTKLGKIVTDKNHHVKPLAVLDWQSGDEEVEHDVYLEEFFLVDTMDNNNPVFVWGHDYTEPQKIHETFDDFLGSLVDFSK